jgi:hypothetical protein
MGHGLCSGAELKHGREARVRGSMASQSQTHLLLAAQPGAQFIQLQVRELEMAEEALV